MTRKVSMWIVLALIGALAATTAATIVLATHDRRDGRTTSALPPADGWPHGWSDAQGDRQVPMMGDLRAGWDGGRDAPILPWVLFAVSTGTAVGLLIAWSPWRAARADAETSGPSAGGDDPARSLPARTTAEPGITAEVQVQTTEETVEAPPER